MHDLVQLVLETQAVDLENLVKKTDVSLTILSPWIKTEGALLLTKNLRDKEILINLYARVNLIDLANGSSDVQAFELLYDSFPNFILKPIPNIHSKVYISDDKSALITSGNLTLGGLSRNVETGVIINDSPSVINITNKIEELISHTKELSKFEFIEIINSNEYKELLESKVKKKGKEQPLTSISFGKRLDLYNEKNNKVLSELRSLKFDLFKERTAQIDLERVIQEIKGIYPEYNSVSNELLESSLAHPALFHNKNLSISFHNLVNIPKAVIKPLIHLNFYSIHPNYSPYLLNSLSEHYFNSIFSNFTLFEKFDLDGFIHKYRSGELREFSTIVHNIKYALIGSLCLHFGISNIWKVLNLKINTSNKDLPNYIIEFENPKTALQEIVQKYYKCSPKYKILNESGADHEKIFKYGVYINNTVIGIGEGDSKTTAQESACKTAFNKLDIKKYLYIWASSKVNNCTKPVAKQRDIDDLKVMQLRQLLKDLSLKKSSALNLNQALTHSSWCNENNHSQTHSNERFSSLGANIWDLYVSTKSFFSSEFNHLSPQNIATLLSPLRLECFKLLNLSRYLLVSKGQKNEGLTENIQINTFLAILSVKFFDSDLYGTFAFLDQILYQRIIEILKLDENKIMDPKGKLQEILLTNGKIELPEYSILNLTGKDHDRTYEIGVFYSNELLGTGVGKSIKIASILAAKKGINKVLSKKYKE